MEMVAGDGVSLVETVGPPADPAIGDDDGDMLQRHDGTPAEGHRVRNAPAHGSPPRRRDSRRRGRPGHPGNPLRRPRPRVRFAGGQPLGSLDQALELGLGFRVPPSRQANQREHHRAPQHHSAGAEHRQSLQQTQRKGVAEAGEQADRPQPDGERGQGRAEDPARRGRRAGQVRPASGRGWCTARPARTSVWRCYATGGCGAASPAPVTRWPARSASGGARRTRRWSAPPRSNVIRRSRSAHWCQSADRRHTCRRGRRWPRS